MSNCESLRFGTTLAGNKIMTLTQAFMTSCCAGNHTKACFDSNFKVHEQYWNSLDLNFVCFNETTNTKLFAEIEISKRSELENELAYHINACVNFLNAEEFAYFGNFEIDGVNITSSFFNDVNSDFLNLPWFSQLGKVAKAKAINDIAACRQVVREPYYLEGTEELWYPEVPYFEEDYLYTNEECEQMHPIPSNPSVPTYTRLTANNFLAYKDEFISFDTLSDCEKSLYTTQRVVDGQT